MVYLPVHLQLEAGIMFLVQIVGFNPLIYVTVEIVAILFHLFPMIAIVLFNQPVVVEEVGREQLVHKDLRDLLECVQLDPPVLQGERVLKDLRDLLECVQLDLPVLQG
jgi:hypothetical protein